MIAMSAASTSTRLTRNSTTLSSDIASLSVREKLIFSQAVYEYGVGGTKAWMDISKLLSGHPLLSGRGDKFFTPQSCPIIYNELMAQAGLEHSEANESVKAPAHLKLAQKHYVTRMQELKEQIAAEEVKFRILVTEIEEIRTGKWDQKILAQLRLATDPDEVTSRRAISQESGHEISDVEHELDQGNAQRNEQEMEEIEQEQGSAEMIEGIEEDEEVVPLPIQTDHYRDHVTENNPLLNDEEQTGANEEQEEQEIQVIQKEFDLNQDVDVEHQIMVEEVEENKEREEEIIYEEEDLVERSTPIELSSPLVDDIQLEEEVEVIEREVDNIASPFESTPVVLNEPLPADLLQSSEDEDATDHIFQEKLTQEEEMSKIDVEGNINANKITKEMELEQVPPGVPPDVAPQISEEIEVDGELQRGEEIQEYHELVEDDSAFPTFELIEDTQEDRSAVDTEVEGLVEVVDIEESLAQQTPVIHDQRNATEYKVNAQLQEEAPMQQMEDTSHVEASIQQDVAEDDQVQEVEIIDEPVAIQQEELEESIHVDVVGEDDATIKQKLRQPEKEEKPEESPRASSRLRSKRREQQQQQGEQDVSVVIVTAATTIAAPPTEVVEERRQEQLHSQEEPVKRPRGRPRKVRPPEPQPVAKEKESGVKAQITRSTSRGATTSTRARSQAMERDTKEMGSPVVDVVGDGDIELLEASIEREEEDDIKIEQDLEQKGRKRDGKRKADDLDDRSGHVEARLRKRARESTATVSSIDVGTQGSMEEAAGSPAALADPPFQSKADRKRFQQLIYMLHSQISQHRNGNIFHNPIKKSEAPDYHEIVKRPIDLKAIRTKVRDGIINSTLEFQRDIYLMFANSLMYNRPHSDIYNLAEEMMLESEAHINAFQQTEGYLRTRS